MDSTRMVFSPRLATWVIVLGATAAAPADALPSSASAVSPTPAWRMLINGFAVIEDGVGTTGRHSDYHGRTMDDDALFELPSFGSKRLRYGGKRSPAAGFEFDEGVLAYRVDGDDLVVSVAAGVAAAHWYQGSSALIGQGDLFLTVRQGDEINHFALLNEINGGRRCGNDGRWRAAQRFRYGGAAQVGHAVLLESEDQISHSGGIDGHGRGGNSPEGLDERVFACGGTDTQAGTLTHYTFDAAQPLACNREVTWHVSEWVIPLTVLGDEEEAMEVAFHIAPSCGNDQLNGKAKIASKKDRQPQEDPEPKPKRAMIN